MICDAEKATGPVMSRPDDPRMTRIGRFLRKYSIDEFPQLVNVLRGEMSLIGPRPERPKFVREFRERIPKYMLRHKVKSGITGWAQVHSLRQEPRSKNGWNTISITSRTGLSPWTSRFCG